MLENFVPETELERAYIQSSGWESQRLWRRARLTAEQEDWTFAAGLNVSRVLDCALYRRRSTLIRTLESINFIIQRLDETQRFSLFRCCSHVIHRLFDRDFQIEDAYVNVILHLMLRLFFRVGELKGTDILSMKKTLDAIYGKVDWVAQFSYLYDETGPAF